MGCLIDMEWQGCEPTECFDIELWPHPWPWPWILKVNFCISRMGGPINTEQKGYESIGCYTYYVTVSYGFDLGYWRSDLKKISIIGIRG